MPESQVTTEQRPHETADELHCCGCEAPGPWRSISGRLLACGQCGFLRALSRADEQECSGGDVSHEAAIGPGSVLRDRYRLLSLIGAGPHGLTYLAHHDYLNHPCVVKVLPHQLASATEASVQRLMNEAAAGFRVNHPNVVRVFDCDASQGHWYIVMEYVDGCDLNEAAAQRVRVPWRQAALLALDAARGLDAVHRRGLIHRDIKPGNLLLGADGATRVADLGLVGFVHGHPALAGRIGHDIVGTLAYASPETFERDHPVDHRADIYSLGVTLYELLCGTLPQGGSIYRSLLGDGGRPLAWPVSAPTDVPAWLVDLVLRMAQPDPRERPRSAVEIEQTLLHGLAATTAPTRPLALEPTEPRGLVVLPLESADGNAADEWLGFAIADHLGRMLSQLPRVYVADREQFQTMLERLERRGPGSRGRRLIEAGRLSGAASVLEGSVQRSGDALTVSVRAIESANDAPRALARVSGSVGRLAELEDELLRSVAAALNLSDAPRARRAAARSHPRAEEQFIAARRGFLKGDYEAALERARAAVEDVADFCEAIGFMGVCCARMGRYDEAAEHNRRQMALAERLDDDRQRIEAHANLGTMHYFRGEYPAARDALGRAMQIAEGLGLEGEVALIRNNLGFLLLQMGDVSEAERMFRDAIDTHKRFGALAALIGPYNGLGHVLREQGDHDEARRHFRKALMLAEESDDYVNIGVAYMNLGRCALLQRRPHEAKQELATALNILERTSFWNGLARVYEYMADLNIWLGHRAEAVRCATMRVELAQRHANRAMEQAAWRQKAEALRLAGRTAEAETCLAHAESAA